MNNTESPDYTNGTSGFKTSNLRWLIIGLIFFVTLINYVDRLTISVLAPVITNDLGLSNVEFGTITIWFSVAYTLSQAVSGKFTTASESSSGLFFRSSSGQSVRCCTLLRRESAV